MFFNVSLIAHKGINIFFDLQILVRIFLFNLSFAQPSLILRSTFAEKNFEFWIVRLLGILNCETFGTFGTFGTGERILNCEFWILNWAQAASLRQRGGQITLRCEPHRLLSFAQPSLILRSTFAQPSLRRILNFEFWIGA